MSLEVVLALLFAKRASEVLLTLSLMALCACTISRRPIETSNTMAEIFGPYPIIKINEQLINPVYAIEIPAGQQTITAQYGTLSKNYWCNFDLKVKAGQRYEVVDHKQQYPITLYEWSQTHGLWADRKKPIQPIGCEKQYKR